MPLTRDEIRAAALHLEPADRHALAEELLLSIDAAWLAEVRRRDAAFEAGVTTMRPVEDAIHRVSRATAS